MTVYDRVNMTRLRFLERTVVAFAVRPSSTASNDASRGLTRVSEKVSRRYPYHPARLTVTLLLTPTSCRGVGYRNP